MDVQLFLQIVFLGVMTIGVAINFVALTNTAAETGNVRQLRKIGVGGTAIGVVGFGIAALAL